MGISYTSILDVENRPRSMLGAQLFLQPQLVSHTGKVFPGHQPIKKLIKSGNLLKSEVEVLYYLQPFVRSESVPGRRCGNSIN